MKEWLLHEACLVKTSLTSCMCGPKGIQKCHLKRHSINALKCLGEWKGLCLLLAGRLSEQVKCRRRCPFFHWGPKPFRTLKSKNSSGAWKWTNRQCNYFNTSKSCYQQPINSLVGLFWTQLQFPNSPQTYLTGLLCNLAAICDFPDNDG